MAHVWIHRIACAALWFVVCLPWAKAQTASGSRITNGVLVIDSERSVPLPQQGGIWTVVYSQSVEGAKLPFSLVGLINSDSNALIPMVLVRYSERPSAWRGSICESTSQVVFMMDFYDTQMSGNSQRCSMVIPIKSLTTFEQTTQSLIWKQAFKGGLRASTLDLPDKEYVRALWRMQEFGRHNLIVEAMVRVDLMGTSGAEMSKAYSINQPNAVNTVIKDWLSSAVTKTAEVYFQGAQSTLAVLDTSKLRQSMKAAVPAQREDFASSPVIGTSMGLVGTESVGARLRSDARVSEAAQAPAVAPILAVGPSAPMPAPAPAEPSAGELAERQRLQALATQREQELERLREQLAQAEAQRLADAKRAAEAQRVADARAAEAAVLLAESQRAAEQQRQAVVLAQAQALRQQAAQQQALAEQQAQAARLQALAQQQAQQQARLAEQAAEDQRVAALNTGKRKALVIGNDVYRSVPKLENARADARAMGQSLEALGFRVTMAMDQTERSMKETLRSFKSTIEGGDEVVVFYAGHGVQLGSINYLLPVDIGGQDEEQVRDEAIQMQRILDDMQERRTGFMLMIVDACRDNPFKVAGRSIGGRGLAPTSAASGQMVIFSAGAGQQALDKLGAKDKEPNGLFTRLFLREMKKPGVSVDRVLRSVRSEVARLARTVGHEQTPALYDQSLGDFFFKP